MDHLPANAYEQQHDYAPSTIDLVSSAPAGGPGRNENTQERPIEFQGRTSGDYSLDDQPQQDRRPIFVDVDSSDEQNNDSNMNPPLPSNSGSGSPSPEVVSRITESAEPILLDTQPEVSSAPERAPVSSDMITTRQVQALPEGTSEGAITIQDSPDPMDADAPLANETVNGYHEGPTTGSAGLSTKPEYPSGQEALTEAEPVQSQSDGETAVKSEKTVQPEQQPPEGGAPIKAEEHVQSQDVTAPEVNTSAGERPMTPFSTIFPANQPQEAFSSESSEKNDTQNTSPHRSQASVQNTNGPVIKQEEEPVHIKSEPSDLLPKAEIFDSHGFHVGSMLRPMREFSVEIEPRQTGPPRKRRRIIEKGKGPAGGRPRAVKHRKPEFLWSPAAAHGVSPGAPSSFKIKSEPTTPTIGAGPANGAAPMAHVKREDLEGQINMPHMSSQTGTNTIGTRFPAGQTVSAKAPETNDAAALPTDTQISRNFLPSQQGISGPAEEQAPASFEALLVDIDHCVNPVNTSQDPRRSAICIAETYRKAQNDVQRTTILRRITAGLDENLRLVMVDQSKFTSRLRNDFLAAFKAGDEGYVLETFNLLEKLQMGPHRLAIVKFGKALVKAARRFHQNKGIQAVYNRMSKIIQDSIDVVNPVKAETDDSRSVPVKEEGGIENDPKPRAAGATGASIPSKPGDKEKRTAKARPQPFTKEKLSSVAGGSSFFKAPTPAERPTAVAKPRVPVAKKRPEPSSFLDQLPGMQKQDTGVVNKARSSSDSQQRSDKPQKPKKSVSWKPDLELVQVKYIESGQQGAAKSSFVNNIPHEFGNVKDLEKKEGSFAFARGKELATMDTDESFDLKPIEFTFAEDRDRGFKRGGPKQNVSADAEEQQQRERTVLVAQYPDKSAIPPSPSERFLKLPEPEEDVKLKTIAAAPDLRVPETARDDNKLRAPPQLPTIGTQPGQAGSSTGSQGPNAMSNLPGSVQSMINASIKQQPGLDPAQVQRAIVQQTAANNNAGPSRFDRSNGPGSNPVKFDDISSILQTLNAQNGRSQQNLPGKWGNIYQNKPQHSPSANPNDVRGYSVYTHVCKFFCERRYQYRTVSKSKEKEGKKEKNSTSGNEQFACNWVD